MGNVKITITCRKIDDKSSFETEEITKGVKGVLPLGCLPLGRREGVTLPSLLNFVINQRAKNQSVFYRSTKQFFKASTLQECSASDVKT